MSFSTIIVDALLPPDRDRLLRHPGISRHVEFPLVIVSIVPFSISIPTPPSCSPLRVEASRLQQQATSPTSSRGRASPPRIGGWRFAAPGGRGSSPSPTSCRLTAIFRTSATIRHGLCSLFYYTRTSTADFTVGPQTGQHITSTGFSGVDARVALYTDLTSIGPCGAARARVAVEA